MNLPVTQREFQPPSETTLLSTTDPKGRITYANEAFIATSGFTREELMGSAHNLVRHPDMPAEAFADMWRTLQAGQSWIGVVKNRRKNGDHYWVRANVAPVVRGGQLVGYMSVRTLASRAEIDAAEALYRQVREGRARGLAFHRGVVVRTGALAWISLPRRLPLRWRLRAGVAAVAALAAAISAAVGVPGSGLAAIAGGTGIGALVAAWWLQRQVAVPVEAILKHASSVSAGQMDAERALERVDEIGLLMRSVNQSGLNLRALVADIAVQTSSLQVASAEIAQGNADLSARTEQTAASLEESAASMEEMGATVHNNADSAREAAQRASATSEVAVRGGDAVSQVVGTMQEISTASSRIADIVGVIDSIAFQTNILALNAAVEAARAGEHGRGFAVVASEVPALAQRSAQSAREIKGLIEDSVGKVEGGTQLVAEAGVTMQQVVDQVHGVSEAIARISTATSEQSAGIGQVGIALAQLDQATQQNAALVEQSAAAAESLRDQAARLNEAIRVFSGAQ